MRCSKVAIYRPAVSVQCDKGEVDEQLGDMMPVIIFP